MRSTGWGPGKGLALTCLASHSGPGAGGLRALCSGFRRVEECDSEECLTRAEIAHFAFFIWGSRFQHRVPLFSHSSLGPQLPRSPTALAFWGQWPLFPVFFDCFYFLTKSCCGNQKMVRTWKRTPGPYFLCPSACSSLHLGEGGAWSHEVCLLSVVWDSLPQGQLQIFLPIPTGEISSALSCRAQEQSVQWAKCLSPA